MRLSVVVPTYQRRDVVVESLRALERQRDAPPFEVVVVVDGSTDGTADALRALEPGFELRILEQPNRGAAVARNRGAREARGEILLFLDDDMEADPGLLAAHDRRHREGLAEAVVGHMPLHPATHRGFLAESVARWVDARYRFLVAERKPIAGSNFLTGQVSIARDRFFALGGFDTRFTRGGSYGREDTDLGHRLVRSGGRIVFAPEAVSWQRYVVDLGAYLRQRRQAGRAAVRLLRLHRDLPDFVVRPQWRQGRFDRWIGRWLALALRPPLVGLLSLGFYHPLLGRLFFWLQFHAYWRGVREAGGYPEPGPVRVLAWHAVEDLSASRGVAALGTPPSTLARQLRTLRRFGWRFIEAEELVALLHAGGGVPRRALLLTFDDAYASLAGAGLEVLRGLGAPGATFAVSGELGGTNSWDERLGLARLPLCDAEALRRLAAEGIEIGSHTRSHASLERLDEAELARELAGSADELEAAGLARPRLLAYPYGRAGAREQAAAAAAGYAAAFTTAPGVVTPASAPHALPRIEIGPRDRGLRLLLRVAFAGRRSASGERARR